MGTQPTAPTPADLRAEIARARLYLYEVAAAAGVPPGRLSAVLGGRAPMSSTFAAHVADSIRALVAARQQT